jgi:hypothetical protein
MTTLGERGIACGTSVRVAKPQGDVEPARKLDSGRASIELHRVLRLPTLRSAIPATGFPDV